MSKNLPPLSVGGETAFEYNNEGTSWHVLAVPTQPSDHHHALYVRNFAAQSGVTGPDTRGVIAVAQREAPLSGMHHPEVVAAGMSAQLSFRLKHLFDVSQVEVAGVPLTIFGARRVADMVASITHTLLDFVPEDTRVAHNPNAQGGPAAGSSKFFRELEQSSQISVIFSSSQSSRSVRTSKPKVGPRVSDLRAALVERRPFLADRALVSKQRA